MTAPLSDDARAIAGGLFGAQTICRNGVYFTKPDQISRRALTAFEELTKAGLIELKVWSDGVEYRQLVDCREHYHWLLENRNKFRGPLTLLDGGR